MLERSKRLHIGVGAGQRRSMLKKLLVTVCVEALLLTGVAVLDVTFLKDHAIWIVLAASSILLLVALYEWWSKRTVLPLTGVTASGPRSVALGGSNTGTIHTGDILENRPFKLTPEFLEESRRRVDFARPIVLRTVRDQNLGSEFETFLRKNGANIIGRKTPGGYNSNLTVERPLDLRDFGDHTEITLDPS